MVCGVCMNARISAFMKAKDKDSSSSFNTGVLGKQYDKFKINIFICPYRTHLNLA